MGVNKTKKEKSKLRKYLFFLSVIILSFPAWADEGKKESAFDSVINSGILRCGYGTWEPGVYKDLQTGKMKGLFVDMMSEVAKISKIKVQWVSEVDWGQIPQSLRSKKIDAFCAGMANDAVRSKQLSYTNPLSYWSFDVIVRADDSRFSPDQKIELSDLNKPKYSMAYSEGDVLETIKLTELPDVKGVPLPPLGTPADNLMNVLTKKTDFVVFPRVMIQGYEKQYGTGKLRLLKMKTPLRVYGNVIAVDISEHELVNFLNAGIFEFINSSSYDRVLAPYKKDYPGAFLKPKLNYNLAD
jgi:ABC-type amino acid transport substrate-binding protein